MMGPPMGPPAHAAPAMGAGPVAHVGVPVGPAHSPPKKSGGPPVLVIALGGLAAVLLVSAGIFLAMGNKSKSASTTAIDLKGTSTAAVASSVAHIDEPPPAEVTSAAPLDTSGVKIPAIPANNTSSGGAKPATPTAPKSAAPVPTPTPVKADPPECVKFRADKAANKPKTMLAAQEARCRAAGGTP